jgi:hypothetical protein
MWTIYMKYSNFSKLFISLKGTIKIVTYEMYLK